MLELRPVCECCGTALAADSLQARICSFECTFCDSCADGPLQGRCPNCGGDLVRRPTRVRSLWERYPPSQVIVLKEKGCVSEA